MAYLNMLVICKDGMKIACHMTISALQRFPLMLDVIAKRHAYSIIALITSITQRAQPPVLRV